eukprot:2146621-Pleurochrysis_carterae.AAC.4
MCTELRASCWRLQLAAFRCETPRTHPSPAPAEYARTLAARESRSAHVVWGSGVRIVGCGTLQQKTRCHIPCTRSPCCCPTCAGTMLLAEHCLPPPAGCSAHTLSSDISGSKIKAVAAHDIFWTRSSFGLILLA